MPTLPRNPAAWGGAALTLATAAAAGLHAPEAGWIATAAAAALCGLLAMRKAARDADPVMLRERRDVAIQDSSAVTDAETALNHLEAVLGELTGYLRRRSDDAPGVRAWRQRRGLRRRGQSGVAVARAVHGPPRYQRATVRGYQEHFRIPLASPIYKASRMSLLTLDETPIINGAGSVPEIWQAVSAAGRDAARLRAELGSES